MNKTGKFIVFEGGEGSGKTSHIKKTAEQLTMLGFNVLVTHEPGGTEFGKKLREHLLFSQGTNAISAQAELFLFLADRAQHVEQVIKPALAIGKLVLCDRFTGSTLAYQIGARNLANPELIKQIESYARDYLATDLTLFLDVDPAIGIARKHKQQQQGEKLSSFDNEALTFHYKVRQYFLQLAKQDNWRVIDTNREKDIVQTDIIKQIKQLL
ncbi:MAG: dTMP kinase [Patescibacteria group bacterium]|jgi:dTMP kinase